MKQIITVTIRANSRSGLTGAHNQLKNAIDEAKLHVGNGSSIQVWETRGDDPLEVQALMGKLKWFSLDREHGPGQYQSPKKKGFWDWVRKEAKGVYDAIPE